MEINMKKYNLDNFSEKDIYTWDEIIAVIEGLEEELHGYKNTDDEQVSELDEQFDEDRLTFAYVTNMERND